MNNFRHQTNVTICARITPRTTLLTMQWQLWFQLIYFHIYIISYIQSHNYLITFCLNVLAWFPSRPYSWTGTRLAHAQAEFPPSHPVLIASYLCFCEFAWTSGGKTSSQCVLLWVYGRSIDTDTCLQKILSTDKWRSIITKMKALSYLCTNGSLMKRSLWFVFLP